MKNKKIEKKEIVKNIQESPVAYEVEAKLLQAVLAYLSKRPVEEVMDAFIALNQSKPIFARNPPNEEIKK